MIDLPLFIKYWGITAIVHNGFGVEWEVEYWRSGCGGYRTSFIIVMSYGGAHHPLRISVTCQNMILQERIS